MCDYNRQQKWLPLAQFLGRNVLNFSQQSLLLYQLKPITLNQSIPCPSGLWLHMEVLDEVKAQELVSRRTHATSMDRYDVVMYRALICFLPLFAPRFHCFVVW